MAVGGGKKVAVATNGTVLPARIRHVRRKIHRVGSTRFRVHRQFIVQHRRRLRPVRAGAVSMAKLFKPRPKNAAIAKDNVTQRVKKRSHIAKIFAGVASMDAFFRRIFAINADTMAVNVTTRAKKLCGIAEKFVGAASMARSSRFRSANAAKEPDNVLVRVKKPREIVVRTGPQLLRHNKRRRRHALIFLAFNKPRHRRGEKVPHRHEDAVRQRRQKLLLENRKGKEHRLLQTAVLVAAENHAARRRLTANVIKEPRANCDSLIRSSPASFAPLR